MVNYFHWPTLKNSSSFLKFLKICHYVSIIHYDKDVLLKVSSWINITIEMGETVWQDDNDFKLIGNIFLHIAVQWVHENSNIKKS